MYVYSIYAYVCLLYLRICIFTLFTDMYIYSTNNNLDMPYNTLDIYDNEKHITHELLMALNYDPTLFQGWLNLDYHKLIH